MISNESIDPTKVSRASKIMVGLQQELVQRISMDGAGPFLAAIYDQKGQLIAKAANSVLNDKCSNHHAEMNAIHLAEQKLNTFDLAPHHLSLYVTSEPCLMCLGGIMWSGIEAVYYGVPSKRVEEITGFDEGFKPNWMDEFKKRGISVYGEIETELGEAVLADYVRMGKKVYKPSR